MGSDNGLSGIYNWFAREPLRLRGLSAIDHRCRNLLLTAAPAEPYEARARFFVPLLRCGVIEFYGAGQFGLSPTCALRSGRQLLIINGHPDLHSSLKAQPNESFPGISRAACGPGQVQALKRFHIPQYDFSLPLLWRMLPQPAAVVGQWPLTAVEDPSRFEYFDRQWKPAGGQALPGVYRRSAKAYAERYYHNGSGNWHILPNLPDNIDAFNQAVLLGRIQNQRPVDITYHDGRDSLTIGILQFPIIAERLLLLNTLLNGRAVGPLNRIYELGKGMLRPFQYYTSNLIHYAE